MSTMIGIIGTMSIEKENLFATSKCELVNTRYGCVPLFMGSIEGVEVAFLNRSGHRHPLEPNEVNYRANILALREVGARRVLGSCVVGSLVPELLPGSLVLLDQFLDFTKHRPRTLFDDYGFAFTDMTDPYCEHIRNEIQNAAHACKLPLSTQGCYVGVDGPRYETAAEVRMYSQLGGHIVGHTGVTEVIMAREAGLCYASIALVANLAAGISSKPISNADVKIARQENAAQLKNLLIKSIQCLSMHTSWSCSCPRIPVDQQIPVWNRPIENQLSH